MEKMQKIVCISLVKLEIFSEKLVLDEMNACLVFFSEMKSNPHEFSVLLCRLLCLLLSSSNLFALSSHFIVRDNENKYTFAKWSDE